MDKLVFNLERVNRDTASKQPVHDLRKGGNLSHVNPKRTSLNQILVGSGDCRKDCEAVIAKKKATLPKNNEKPFNRFVIGASPEHFLNEHGQSDPRKVAAFKKKAMAFLEERFGDGLAYAVLHLDETTPHIHAVTVPLVEKTTKKGKKWTVSHHQHPAFKGFNSYDRLRHEAADSLGLDYGEPGNKPQTKAQREAAEELERQSQELEARKRATLAEIEAKRAEVIAMAETVRKDAKRLGEVVGFPDYAEDPTVPEARQAVRSKTVEKAAERATEPTPAPALPVQPEAAPGRSRPRFSGRPADSR